MLLQSIVLQNKLFLYRMPDVLVNILSPIDFLSTIYNFKSWYLDNFTADLKDLAKGVGSELPPSLTVPCTLYKNLKGPGTKKTNLLHYFSHMLSSAVHLVQNKYMSHKGVMSAKVQWTMITRAWGSNRKGWTGRVFCRPKYSGGGGVQGTWSPHRRVEESRCRGVERCRGEQ